MTISPESQELLYSSLATEPDLQEIVALFVSELPDRVATVEQLLGTKNWDELRRIAHQMKGTAGSYGFQPITILAARLEDGLKQTRPFEDIQRLAADLISGCRRARAGLPE